MSNHYFSTRPEVGSRPKQIRARLRGREWTFLSDRGVFARGGVDAGTRLLAKTMRIAPADHILDIGCGYGPVGLVAAWLAPDGQAVLVDVNERAVMLAAQNARLNGLANVEVLQGDGCGPVAGRFFDAAVTNPPIRAGKATLRRLVREIWQHLRPGGRFYFVARTAQGARTLARDVTEVFGGARELERESGYRVYEAIKDVEELKS
ncbi:MAG: class I SAM-dependent methyltransferase [Bacillati bacterium ANGP1]|uniref:Class I SAM-dependent methyltransferase n=1 Tax=Candidatus Segetimicrobium genomatis TaxID=2569760 RepID=A0A537IW65_9BACT|nr:MAG: class I SAM-dependent methyltransferase [Terrabacteria group bacterium ANGP1]